MGQWSNLPQYPPDAASRYVERAFPGLIDCDGIAGLMHWHQCSLCNVSGLYDAYKILVDVDFDRFVGLLLDPHFIVVHNESEIGLIT